MKKSATGISSAYSDTTEFWGSLFTTAQPGAGAGMIFTETYNYFKSNHMDTFPC